ncbi:CvpA family protein [Xanthomonas albilineans]|uniref:CvpA family protein n=1 Tax=Xanthomonas albilineans TaxID=29447 RepID=UPI0005F341AF|nr:CvpA family protein [Xanthomonas albilineans]
MIDIVLLAVILVSALLGALRGFVGIVVGTLSWLLAGWASFRFGGDVGRWLADSPHPSMSYYLGGYALTFVTVMAVVGITGMVIRTVVRSTMLSGTDRALGFGLGALRGGFFAAVLILLMSFTPLTREPQWRQSILLPVLSPGVSWMRAQLPDWRMPQLNMSQLPQLNMSKMDLGNMPAAGDNATVHNAVQAKAMQDMMSKALGRSGARSAPAGSDSSRLMPANIDPAQARPAVRDPAWVQSNGQARPPSQ